MTKTEFEKSFGLLENAFGMQNPERRQFYFHQFEHSLTWAFDRAIRRIIEIRDDGYGFPLIAEIRTSIDEVLRQSSETSEADLDGRQFCQRCSNSGLYQTDHGAAAACVCRAGRLKQARLILGLSARRTEVEEYAKTKLPPAEPPIRGLKERNPLGFWEDTQEEHDIWMERKRCEIKEIKHRREIEPKREDLPTELRRQLLKDTVAGIGKRIVPSVIREPGKDAEEDEVGF